MCDYCSCRTMPVIDALGADHDELLHLASLVRRAIGRGDHPAAGVSLDRLVALLRVHTAVEEASVFAALRAAGEFPDRLDGLLGDHAAAWDAVARLGVAGGDGWAARVLALLDDLAAHIALEEYDLFPASLLAVALPDWAAVEAAAGDVRSRAAAPGLR